MVTMTAFRYGRNMILFRSLAAVTAGLVLAACASPAPAPPVVADSRAGPVAVPAAPGVADDEGEDDGIIKVVDIPKPEAAPVDPVDAESASGLVCRKEITTGSHRVKKVCRTSAEIEQRRQADVDMIRQLQTKSVAPKPPG